MIWLLTQKKQVGHPATTGAAPQYLFRHALLLFDVCGCLALCPRMALLFLRSHSHTASIQRQRMNEIEIFYLLSSCCRYRRLFGVGGVDMRGWGSAGDMAAIRDAATALEILDIDGDGKIGLLDFIHFAARLKTAHEVR